MKKVLIIRLSALGDVAMSIPVVYSLASAYPKVRFTVLTQVVASRLFINRPPNVELYCADVKGSHAGWRGMLRLFGELKQQNFDAVADLHDVIRSKFLRLLFRLSGVKTARINKGRAEKKRLTATVNKQLKPLKSSFERYIAVFRQLGFDCDWSFVSLYRDRADRALFSAFVEIEKHGPWIGIAPFAKHKGKIYPAELMEKVIAELAGKGKYQLFLFGGGEDEERILNEWADRYPNTRSVVGHYGFEKELALMSWLDVMITMDSANMHLASLVAVPVVSVWGATHPYAGFMGWRQDEKSAIGVDLYCRPCSVFGNKPCMRGDYACLTRITPEEIVARTELLINLKK